MFPGETGPNLLATAQAIPAAAEVTFPFTAGKIKGAVPKLTCPT
jgi:hypothetical protein